MVVCGVCAGAVAAWGRLDKMAIENCICTIALALAAVMAGSGHLQTLCLFRGVKILLDPMSAAECSLLDVLWKTSYHTLCDKRTEGKGHTSIFSSHHQLSLSIRACNVQWPLVGLSGASLAPDDKDSNDGTSNIERWSLIIPTSSF